MKPQHALAALAIATLLLILPSPLAAQVHWGFNEPVLNVQTDDRVIIYGTFFNDSSSPVIMSNVSGSFAGWIHAYYDFNGRFHTSLTGLELAPGESQEFLFGWMSPKESRNGHVPPGVYFSEPLGTYISLDGVPFYSDNRLEIRVTGVVPNFAIPEPGTLPFVAAMAVAAIGAGLHRRRRSLLAQTN